MDLIGSLRAMGSAALNMASVASGGADCYFEYGIHVWDIGITLIIFVREIYVMCFNFFSAAGTLIVREAGGVCIDTEGAA